MDSDPNPTDLGGLITPSSSAPSQQFLTNQLGGQQTRALTFHNIQIPPQADQQQNASRASLSSTSANDHAQPSNNNMVRNPKNRSRASRRAPTTVLTTDTTNFRAMVQEFTGIPAPPFTSSPFPRSRLDLFGTSSSLRSSGPTGLDPSPPPYLLRPFAQKVQPLPFGSSTSSTTSVIDVLGSNPTTNASNSTYQPKFSLSNSPNIDNLGSKPQGGSLEIPSNDHSHLKMGTSVLEEFGLTQQQQQQHPHHHQQQQQHHHHHHVSTQLMSGLPNIVSSDGTTLSRTDNNNNSNNNNPPPTNWTNDTGLNGSYSNSERVTNNEKLNYSAAASASSSDFHHGDKGLENVATRSEESVRGKDLIGIEREKRSYPMHKAVDMTIDSSGETKFEIEKIWYEASQKQPEGIEMMSDVEAMQPQATRTLKPQGLVFDVEAFKIAESSRQKEFQIEDIEMEPEAIEQHGSEADQHEAAQLLIQAGLGLTKPPKDEDWENTKEIYLMNNELSILPENPMCPQLSALFLQRNYKLRTIPPSFFDYMPALQILNLSRTGIKSLPDSLIRLVSLKRLFLNYCRCFMILSPHVGELKQLEVLDLEGTEIMHLPQEIKKLTNLTCLEVSFYGYTSDGRRAMQSNALVPCGVIFALSQLEELNIDLNPDDKWWDAHVEGILSEVCNLKRLNALKFYFPRVELLRYMQWNSPISLSHFRFTVGHHVKRIMSRVPHDVVFELERWERCLKYINGSGDIPRDFKKALQHATAFFLDRHATAKSLSNFGTQNMEKLKCCVMGECKEVKVIIDEADAYEEDDDSNEIASDSYGTEKIVLGSLEYLYVYRMNSLRSLWNGQLQWKSLFLLKSLTFHTCPQLTTIFVPGFLDKLCKLEELTVKDCPSIRSLVSCEITAEHKTSNFLPNLKRIALHYMPELVSISSGLHIAPKLEWSSFYNCKNLKNPFIEGISSKDLKKIEGEESWWKELKWSNGGQDYYDKFFVPIAPWDCPDIN